VICSSSRGCFRACATPYPLSGSQQDRLELR
jgi:hypothetical protein